MTGDPVDVLIAAESAADGPTLAATLELLAAEPGVGRVVVVAPAALAASRPGAGAPATWLAPDAFEPEGWRGGLAGRDALVLAGAAALLPGALASLRAALRPFRVAAASAWSAGGLVLAAPAAEAGADGRPTPAALSLATAARTGPDRTTPVGAAEPAATLFRGDALVRLRPLPPEPATALVERLSHELARVGLLRVAAPRALLATRPGWLPAPSPDPSVAAKHAALRQADARRRAFLDVGALAGGPAAAPRRPRVALDLTGIPWRGVRMNGTRRFALAAARALDQGLGAEADLELVVDDARDDLDGVAPGRRRVLGLAGAPAARYDAALRPAGFHSTAAVLELARASRSFSLVVLDLIAVLLEDVNSRPRSGEAGGRGYDLAPTLADRAVLDLALARCRRAYAIGPAALEELELYVSDRPTLRPRLGVVPLADLRPAAAAPAPVPALVGRRFVLWVGNGQPHKRLDEVLAAWGAARARATGASLVLLGAPPPDGAPGDVVGLRDVDEAALAWLYGTAAAVVSTSLWEGFGLPVLEAAQGGAAVIAARTPQTEAVLGADHPGLFRTRAELAALLGAALGPAAPDLRAPGAAARFPWADFQAALVADVRAALAADPATPLALPLDAAALLDPPRAFPPRGPAPAAAAWLGRQLERRSPWLARLGRRVADAARRRPDL